MRVAVISDVHGNARALEAVLLAIDADGIDTIWCLGDTVGYGARPNDCCEIVRARSALVLAGNHDLVVAGVLSLEEFSHDAAEAVQWSRVHLDESARIWLSALVPQAEADGLQLFHGSPRDPVWEYVLSEYAAYAALEETTAPVVLVGHSHVALALGLADGNLVGGLAPAGSSVSFAERRWLLNPGSVGQPRDGDSRAAYLVVDLDERVAQFHRVEYDIAGAQWEIREAGLPDALAARLERGE